MRWSKLFIPTLRNNPADVEGVAGQLLVRAGYRRQLFLGVHANLFMAIAQDLGRWDLFHVGFPTVLKANGTSGGDGVKVVNTVEEAERAFRKLQAPPLMARAIKRAVIDQDPTLVWPSLFRRRFVVNAQAFVAGREATSAIACWQGKVLASLHFEVLKKTGATGHATVLRLIEHPEMTAAAEKVARRFKLSGLHGLDFMLEAHTGNALIEINPRTTQVGHLALGLERDLPAALYAALTGKDVQAAAKVTENDTIALSQEWARDPKSDRCWRRCSGPATRVAAVGRKARDTRVIGSGPRAGTEFTVEVPTYISALAEYAGGQAASMLFSWDSPLHRCGFVEITGTEATLAVPDPNRFDGDLRVRRAARRSGP